MPIPSGELEAEMLCRREMSEIRADKTYDQKRRAYDDMETVKAGRHEERGAVRVAAESERRVAVLEGLHAGEGQTKHNGQYQAPFESLAVVLQKRMVRPRHGRSGGEQDERIQQRQMPWIEGLDPVRRPHSAEQLFAGDLGHVGREQRA